MPRCPAPTWSAAPARRSCEIVDDAPARVGAEDLQTRVAGQGDRFGEVDLNGERQVEQAAGGGADRLGVVDIDGVTADQDRVGAECVGTSDHRAEVARIADLIAEHDQPWTCPQALHRGHIDIWQTATMPCGVTVSASSATARSGATRDGMPAGRRVQQIDVAIDGVVGDDQLE